MQYSLTYIEAQSSSKTVDKCIKPVSAPEMFMWRALRKQNAFLSGQKSERFAKNGLKVQNLSIRIEVYLPRFKQSEVDFLKAKL